MSLNGHSVAGTMKSVYVEVVGVAFDGCLVLNVHTAMGIRNFHLYLEVCLPVWASHAQNPRRRTFLVQIERVLAFLKFCSIGKNGYYLATKVHKQTESCKVKIAASEDFALAETFFALAETFSRPQIRTLTDFQPQFTDFRP